jgi:malate dehydrogenase (oxaloacetate-decarboxylating)
MTTSGPENKAPVEISYTGPSLLNTSILNKGCAFSAKEREELGLTGLLPHRFETIETQVQRCYQQYQSFDEPINKHIYLRNVQDKNETLFYRLVQEHIEEMMPIIYTPVVGEACERFSEIYRQNRGLFISYEDRDRLDQILANVTKPNIKVIVVTDGSRILGLGDQGIGGMGIPIGKLSLYTACGGISPAYTLPITLDVGTNNQELLDDPLYMGWHHKRIGQKEYDAFIALLIQSVKKRWPNVLLQFEDFEQKQAQPLLARYRDQLCCFNDDIQGTASVTAGTLLAACKVKGEALKAQTVVFVGAGSAGCGIADQLVAHMQQEGLTKEQAQKRIYILGRNGLLTDKLNTLTPSQQPYMWLTEEIASWAFEGEQPNLSEVIINAKPTVLIGVSGQPGLFTQDLVNTMQQDCERPIIFPLSNPSKKIEATPQDLLEWTDGNAILATGSPFEPIKYQGKVYPIPQCNNSYIFPGIGLAVVAGDISLITDEMLMKASEVLAQESPLFKTGEGSILPPLADITEVSKKIAYNIIRLAQEQGLAPDMDESVVQDKIEANFWLPEYRQYQLK